VAVLLTVEGLHEPVIPFVEVDGSTGASDPAQIGAIELNEGITKGFTVTVNNAVVAQGPELGVKT